MTDGRLWRPKRPWKLLLAVVVVVALATTVEEADEVETATAGRSTSALVAAPFSRASAASNAQQLHTELSLTTHNGRTRVSAPILSVFSALIVHSELKSVHPGFPVAFIF